MPELVVIVPSRGRPRTVAELAAAFQQTCTAPTGLAFAVDADDPDLPAYREATTPFGPDVWVTRVSRGPMVAALNEAAHHHLSGPPEHQPVALGFMGDDHRPRTTGWDRAWLDALAARPGIVYGDDLIQGELLPTQCAMSAGLVRALGHMAPPVLTHLYVDNYWLALGRAADCITYLPNVTVEHLHPITSKVDWDEGHRRVNQPAMYERDRAAFEEHWRECGARDVEVARAATAVRA